MIRRILMVAFVCIVALTMILSLPSGASAVSQRTPKGPLPAVSHDQTIDLVPNVPGHAKHESVVFFKDGTRVILYTDADSAAGQARAVAWAKANHPNDTAFIQHVPSGDDMASSLPKGTK